MKDNLIFVGVIFAGFYALREYEDSQRLGAPMFSQQLRLLREQEF